MAKGIAVLSDTNRQECIDLATRIGAPAAAAQYGVKTATVRAWMSLTGVAGPSAETQNARIARRTAMILSAADRLEDYLEEIRNAAAIQIATVANVSAQYAMKVATMDPTQIIERRDSQTGQRWVEFADDEAEGLRRQLRAYSENDAFNSRDAVNALSKATHDLRLLREQSTENIATSVSFVADLAPEPKVIEGEIIEAEEID